VQVALTVSGITLADALRLLVVASMLVDESVRAREAAGLTLADV
jgi:hypothetical protein